MLSIINSLPKEVLNVKANDIYKIFPQTTLVSLDGANGRPLFISCLIHGLETTGLLAIQKFLKLYNIDNLPRPILILFGNIEAARFSKRHLDNQPDYNRIWKEGPLKENRMAMDIFSYVRNKNPYACIDIHNNTGKNPFYSCVSRLDEGNLALANGFSELALHFEKEMGSLSQLFEKVCPSITLEAGLPGSLDGISHVTDYLSSLYKIENLKDLNAPGVKPKYHKIYASIKVHEDSTVAFDSEEVDIRFIEGFDSNNFKVVKKDTIWATLNTADRSGLVVVDIAGNDIYKEIFEVEGRNLVNKKDVIPAMFTTNHKIMKTDCVCYLLEGVEV